MQRNAMKKSLSTADEPTRTVAENLIEEMNIASIQQEEEKEETRIVKEVLTRMEGEECRKSSVEGEEYEDIDAYYFSMVAADAADDSD